MMEVQNIETLNLIQFLSVKAPDRVIKIPVTDDEMGRTVDCNIYHPKYGYKGKIVTRKKGVLSYSRAEYKISYTDPVTGNTILCQHDLQLLCCEEDGTFTNKDGIKMRFIDLVEHQTRLAEKKNDFEEIYKREIETKGLEGKEFSDDVFKDELINYLGKLIVDCKKVAAYDEVNAGGSYIEILSVADRFKNWLNTITILHSVPFIGELFSKHLTISTKIKEAYYSLVPQPTKREDVPEYYKGDLSCFNQPYRVCIYGAYLLTKQWEIVDHKMKESNKGNQRFSEWERGKVFEAMKEYAKGFQIGYNNFLKDIIDNKDNLSNSEKVRLQKIKDYVFNRWNNEPGFSESNESKTGNPFSNWFEDGKEGGYYYRAWYLILENHLAFAPLFEGKAAGIELNNKVDEFRKIFVGEDQFQLCLNLLEDVEVTRNGECILKRRAGKLFGVVVAVNETPGLLKQTFSNRNDLLKHFNKYLGTAFTEVKTNSKAYSESIDDAKRYIRNNCIQ